ncbi:L-threonylcarbamoyladenylate synthase [Planctomicrobium sp. SH668]|uniref:L-threonylcarbamoyladenylate synthase n=1 Tax=Planctomicrobium sp. SH668 TaxID=3448126 RepID=UPI003F5C98E8
MAAELTDDVLRASLKLKEGGLVAFATETVYGLGGNALDVAAVSRIFSAKQRPHFDPLIVHLSDAADVSLVVQEVPELAHRLMTKFWPGPLTLVLPKKECVPDLVTAGLPSVAVRVPDHPVARELIRLSGVPVAAPSANPFGRISPTTSKHVLDYLSEEIDMVLDGGPCRIGVESTVLLVAPNQTPILLRHGGLSVEDIENEIGPIDHLSSRESEGGAQIAPGRLLKHYAPRKPLQIIDHWGQAPTGPNVAAMSFGPLDNSHEFGCLEILSLSSSLTEAAANFFAALRRLDDSQAQRIVATRFPEHGLGAALNDRLSRAAR